MLKYNFDRIFKARGIDKPYTYLVKSGFSSTLATKIKNNNLGKVYLATLEKLSTMLRCTPNDLLEWVPENDSNLDGEHPLFELKRNDKVIDITKILNNVPLSQLGKIEKIIIDNLE